MQKGGISGLVRKKIEISFCMIPATGSTSGFSCCARKAQASPFDIKTALAGRTLTPMPPPGGKLTVELRHKSEMHIGAAIRSAAWGALCRCVRFYGPTAHPCRSALHKRRVRPPWRCEENRIKNFDWVILFGYSKPILIPRMGEQCEEQKCA